MLSICRLVPVAVLCAGFLGSCEPATPALPAPGKDAIAITVRSEPPGASVLVDGVVVGAAPQTVRMNPGPHRIKAMMSGYYPSQESRIQVGGSESREHTLTLVASH